MLINYELHNLLAMATFFGRSLYEERSIACEATRLLPTENRLTHPWGEAGLLHTLSRCSDHLICFTQLGKAGSRVPQDGMYYTLNVARPRIRRGRIGPGPGYPVPPVSIDNLRAIVCPISRTEHGTVYIIHTIRISTPDIATRTKRKWVDTIKNLKFLYCREGWPVSGTLERIEKSGCLIIDDLFSLPILPYRWFDPLVQVKYYLNSPYKGTFPNYLSPTPWAFRSSFFRLFWIVRGVMTACDRIPFGVLYIIISFTYSWSFKHLDEQVIRLLIHASLSDRSLVDTWKLLNTPDVDKSLFKCSHFLISV